MDSQNVFSLRHYAGDIPTILKFQLFLQLCLMVIVVVCRFIRDMLLSTTDRSALTSGDLGFIFFSVQGWILMTIGIFVLAVYIVLDINAMILLSAKILHQEPVHFTELIRDAFLSMKRIVHPKGLLLILYCAFLVPLTGIGFQISYTSQFYIPDFITAVIESNAIGSVLYMVGIILLAIITVRYIFTFHCILFRKESVGAAITDAGKLMKTNWRDFLKRYLKFLFRFLLAGVIIASVLVMIVLGIGSVIDAEDIIAFRFFMILTAFLVIVTAGIYLFLFIPFQMLAVTRIYESYTSEDEGEIKMPRRRPHPWMALTVIVCAALIVICSYFMALGYEEIRPDLTKSEVIVHRGGGNLSGENTVSGVLKAYEAGAYASEIDVQRTLDGQYILNHDKTFLRLTGDKRKPSEMTLEEIKSLTIRDTGEQIATFEEILDAAKGKIHLYVELKGSTADQQMAEDLYEMVQEKNMLNQVTFISLKYPVISGLEKQHPDAITGYLCYAGFGELEYLDVDELILEEETATVANIDKIQSIGKQVVVWTVNNEISMVRFYTREVDAIITDDVENSIRIKEFFTKITGEEHDEYVDVIIGVVLTSMFVWWPS